MEKRCFSIKVSHLLTRAQIIRGSPQKLSPRPTKWTNDISIDSAYHVVRLQTDAGGRAKTATTGVAFDSGIHWRHSINFYPSKSPKSPDLWLHRRCMGEMYLNVPRRT